MFIFFFIFFIPLFSRLHFEILILLNLYLASGKQKPFYYSTWLTRPPVILFVSFQTSCGDKAVSDDKSESLAYTCANDSAVETFSIRTFRYYGAEEGDAVYFHCDLRVCLADVDNSACQCPSVGTCNPNARKRRSVADEVDKNKVYHASAGPFIFKNDEEEEEQEEGGM